MSWECLRNKPATKRNGNINKAHKESSEEAEVNNPPKEGESLMLKKVLVKIEKKVHEPAQRNIMFMTKCKSQGKCCKMVIDSGSIDNLGST